MAAYTLNALRAEYLRLWAGMKVTRLDEANKQARYVIANKQRYKAVEAATSVPWFVVGCLHMRESNGNFATYLGNGQRLDRKTTIVPIGRGPWVTFEEGAVDALVNVEHLNEIKTWGPEHVAFAMEKFNGFGYRAPTRNIPSPYLWGGTSAQKPGKFVRDGVYDPTVMDTQIGGMAVLNRIMALDPEARFRGSDSVASLPKPIANGAPEGAGAVASAGATGVAAQQAGLSIGKVLVLMLVVAIIAGVGIHLYRNRER